VGEKTSRLYWSGRKKSEQTGMVAIYSSLGGQIGFKKMVDGGNLLAFIIK
jgi:hypothetical protein